MTYPASDTIFAWCFSEKSVDNYLIEKEEYGTGNGVWVKKELYNQQYSQFDCKKLEKVDSFKTSFSVSKIIFFAL